MPIGVPSANNEGQWTFLEICQRTVRECGVSHSATLVPTTVVNQVGEMRRIVDWVAEAWFDIQQLHSAWRFKRHTTSFETIAGQAQYNYVEAGIDIGTFGRWIPDSFRVYRTGQQNSEIPMGVLPYDIWRDTYQLGALRTALAQPQTVTVTPSDGIGLGSVPLAGYTILGDYYTAPIRMEGDEEVPELPLKHSPMVIVRKAQIDYALFESAAEQLARGERGFRELLYKLEADQLEQPRLLGALA